MKLKQIIEDEFDDLDDQDEFGTPTLEIDPEGISYEKRRIVHDSLFTAYTNIVLSEFSCNGVLISLVVSTLDKRRVYEDTFGWWIDDKPLNLMSHGEIINILNKLGLNDFIGPESHVSAYMFLFVVLEDTADKYNLDTTSKYNFRHG